VVDGEVVAGEFARAAAERHLRDLVTGKERGLYWAPELAERAIGFFPAVLAITAGALEGKPFVLLPWHVFAVGSLFGWRKTSGRMRFRSGWLETGKGQAKSPLMAGIGIYMGGYYDIARAEIYSIGQDRATANVLFKDAVAMCRANIPGTPEFETDSLESREEVMIRGAGDNAWKIEWPASGSKFQSLANGEAISGPRPTAVLADEIHEFKTNHSIEVWKQAIAKMPGDALMLLGTNTPASTQIVGTDYSEYYQRVARGEIQDDEAFSFIARVDKADRETVFENEECWKKSLPALGVTFPVENIRGQVNTAKQLLSTALSVKRLYFGIPTGSVEFWIAEESWQAVQGAVDEADYVGVPCWLSLDLSKKNDLTALSACWADEAGEATSLAVKTWYWTVQDGIADRSRADMTPYDQWVQKDLIEAVPGAVIEKTWVAAQVQRLCAVHDVQFLAFDPAGIADFIAACEMIGFPVWRYEGPDKPEGNGLKLVSHAQGKLVRFEDKQLTMPRSIERLEDRILKREVVIDASPVTYACAANAMVDSDGQGNRCFDKKRSRGRIDGMVTVAMAVGAATNEFGAKPETKPELVLL
jgi:phage terminase large subunit-like protein